MARKRRNVVFLDFDGVIINRASLMKASGIKAKAHPTCVEALNRICAEGDAKIVVSSTWRLLFKLPALRDLMASWGIKAKVIGRTPEHHHAYRGEEIADYVARHKIDAFVILDDDDDMKPFMSKLVQTRFEEGLTERHADLALRQLK